MQTPKVWTVEVKDAGDGSGDLLIELPEDLLARSGWQIGDEFEWSMISPGCVRLSKMAD